MKRLLLLLAATAICGACENQTPQSSPPETRIAAKEAEQLLTDGAETLTIGSNSFVLEAYLWRDFMPVWASEEEAKNGRPMISVNWLVDVNSTAIPDNITMVKQYVIYGDLIWEADYEDGSPAPSLPAFKLERVSIGGPKWGPKIYVDVISEIHDSDTQKSYFIKCENVLVERTD